MASWDHHNDEQAIHKINNPFRFEALKNIEI